MPLLTTNMSGYNHYQSTEYNDKVRDMQKKIVSFELKLFKNLLKDANNKEEHGAIKFFMRLYDELNKNNLDLSFFVRDYNKKQIDDYRIIVKILLARLEQKYLVWLKKREITHGKPTARVYIDNNIFEYNKDENNVNKIIKVILPLFNIHKKNWMSYKQLIIGVDFDGVIHEHNIPFEMNPKDLFGYKVNQEIRSLLQTLKSTFDTNIQINIVTMRAYDSKHSDMVSEYLDYYNIPFDIITTRIHPETNLMIDDNAVLVQSLDDTNGLINYIANRLPWYIKQKEEKTMAVKKIAAKKVAPKKAVVKKTAVKKTATKKTTKK